MAELVDLTIWDRQRCRLRGRSLRHHDDRSVYAAGTAAQNCADEFVDVEEARVSRSPTLPRAIPELTAICPAWRPITSRTITRS